jgi:hypothetical protein
LVQQVVNALGVSVGQALSQGGKVGVERGFERGQQTVDASAVTDEFGGSLGVEVLKRVSGHD